LRLEENIFLKGISMLKKLKIAKVIKPLVFINTGEMRKSFDILNKKIKMGLIEKDTSKNLIKFMNDSARRDAFNILGKEYIKKFTNWEGPSIWE
jgi:hypothetical protein